MKRNRVIALATLTGLTYLFYTTSHSAQQPVRRWGQFYFWKLLSGQSHSSQNVLVDDISIHCETFGAGSPVLVLHGGLGSIEGMEYQIRALASSHLVIAADSRGHGRSTDSTAPLSYSTMSDDMVKLLDRLHIHQVDVVGWSDGGIIGLDLAMRHPDRVRKLVAISANYDVDGLAGGAPPSGEMPRAPLRYRLFAPDPAHWPILYRKVVTMWQTQPHYSLSELGRIQAPTLIIAGEYDAIKREHTDQLARAIPNSREWIVPGATHSVPTDKPEIVDPAILNFLKDN